MRGPAALFLATLCLAGCEEPRAPEPMSPEQVARELAAMRIDPGLWELSTEVTEVSAPDLPREVRNRMVGPRSRIRNCISAEQAARPGANFLAARADTDCRYRDFRVEDGRLSGSMICPGATARMEGRFDSDSYETRMEMKSPMDGGAVMTLQLRASGRRIGPCEGEGE